MRFLLVAAFAAAGASAWAGEEVRTVEPAANAVVRQMNDFQREYFATPRAQREVNFTNKVFRHKMAAAKSAPLPVRFSWTGGEPPFVVRVCEGDRVFIETNLAARAVDLYNFKIATTYRWTVTSAGKTAESTFRTEDRAPRLIRVPGLHSVRDLGGRRGLDGRRIRQGLVYRSCGLNANAKIVYSDKERKVIDKDKSTVGKSFLSESARAYVVDVLGIRTEIDLRSPVRETLHMTGSPLGEKVKWLNYSSSAYGAVVRKGGGAAAFAKVFAVFLDEANYPIDFHCIAGRDRTGTVAFLLLALLGVDEDELAADWEALGFQFSTTALTHARTYNGLPRSLLNNKELAGTTLCEKTESFVKSLGFTDEQIAKFRSIMLEPKE